MRNEIHHLDYPATLLVALKRIFANPLDMNG